MLIFREIINERLKQQAGLIDVLHFLKIIIDMRNDQDNSKFSQWNINYLFGTFLFHKYIDIMGHIEMIYVSFVTICKCICEAPESEGKKTQEGYREHMLACFESIVDFYEVMFRNIHTNMLNYVSATKKVSAETKKNYLRTLKIGNFFEYSGNKHVVSVGIRKRRDGDINFKFLKMLLARSEEFHKFVKSFDKMNDASCMEAFEFQCLQMLNRLLLEDEMRQKEEQEREEREKAEQEAQSSPDNIQDNEVQDSVRKASVQSNGTVEGEPQLQRLESKKRVFGYNKRARENHLGEIMFEEDDDDEMLGRPTQQSSVHRAHKLDDKTRKYLEKIKNYQDEDEYDDTHDVGERRPNRNRFKKEEEAEASSDPDDDGEGNTRSRRKQKQAPLRESRPANNTNNRNNGKKAPKKDDESDDPDIEDSSEEDADVISNWERKHSKIGADQDQNDDDNTTNKSSSAIRGGGFRGGRGGYRGSDDKKRDMKREKHNQAKYQPHEKSRKEVSSYYPRTQDSRQQGEQVTYQDQQGGANRD